MDVHESLLELIGDTPLVRLRTPGDDHSARLYAKLEYLSVGGSVKDRIALRMIEDAERRGLLKPGGTVVEASSGNTGVGLALVAAAKGYRAVIVIPDKTSAEKAATLRALGAEVVVRPGMLPIDHPDQVVNTATRLAAEIPGGWMAAQYDNPANPEAHYATTGPEIWQQTEGRITHLVCCVGTGGTISGTGRYLKEVSGGGVRVIGADPDSSVYSGGDGRPYFVEAAGRWRHPETPEDCWPASFHQEVVDEILPVTDRESIMTIRRTARESGLLVGGSAGTALAAARRVAAGLGPDDLVVAVLPDSGKQYLSKYFDDGWLLRLGFLDGDPATVRVADALTDGERARPLPYLHRHRTVGEALAELRAREAAGAEPVLPAGPAPVGPSRRPTAPELVGAVRLVELDEAVAAGRVGPDQSLDEQLGAPLPQFGGGESAEQALATLRSAPDATAVVLHDGHAVGLVTEEQLRAALGRP
ncbi:pyridoxal-phosphate dependent enzyme [Kitasatospora sp. NPDC052896]|uniref:pyridoxal-phosphate dependent enzyme n=1 Tax=Kitasatospora sp. NPDC052896 TaxID=3364061 RepID=UPI0037C92CCC